MSEEHVYPPASVYLDGLRGRCPRCSKGHMFDGLLAVGSTGKDLEIIVLLGKQCCDTFPDQGLILGDQHPYLLNPAHGLASSSRRS